MAIKSYTLTLDMEKEDRSPVMISGRVGDKDSIKIIANLLQDGKPFTPNGASAFFECINGAKKAVRVQATKGTNKVEVTVPAEAFAGAGIVQCAYFRFESGDPDDPTLIESTQSFGIIIEDSIDGKIDADHYIAEWRGLSDQLKQQVDEVNAAAVKAKADIKSDVDSIESAKTKAVTDINADVSTVEQAKASASKLIAEDVKAVDDSKNAALTSISSSVKLAESEAAKVATKGDDAVKAFNTKGDKAISDFNTKGNTAIKKVGTDADAAISSHDAEIAENVKKLEKATQDAIDAMESALSEDQYGELVSKLSRVWKLSGQDMTLISANTDLNTLSSVGTYYCKTSTDAQKIVNKPTTMTKAFYLFVLEIDADNKTQLLFPYNYDSNDKYVVYVRGKNASAAWTQWAEVGRGADISAGIGIKVEGDAEKKVSVDNSQFFERHEGARIISGSSEVTGGARISDMVVYGETKRNLWVNPVGKLNGITIAETNSGLLNISGTATKRTTILIETYALEAGKSYKASVNKALSTAYAEDEGAAIGIEFYNKAGWVSTHQFGYGDKLQLVVKTPADMLKTILYVRVQQGYTLSLTDVAVLLTEAEGGHEDWSRPGLQGVEVKNVLMSGRNLWVNPNSGVYRCLTVTSHPDGSVSIHGNAKANIYASAKIVIPLSEATVTLSLNASLPLGVNAKIDCVDESSEIKDSFFFGTNYDDTVTVTIPEGIVSVNCTIRVLNGYTVDVDGLKFMFNIGSIAYPWEPSRCTQMTLPELVTLHRLPNDTRDELRIDSDGKVTLVQKVGVVTYDGSSDENYYWDSGSVRIEADLPVDAVPGTLGVSKIMADVISPRKGTQSNVGSYVIVANSNKAYIRIDSLDTIDKVKAALAATPLTVHYPLAELNEIDLGYVSVEGVESSKYNVWTDSIVKPQMSVGISKVDYLPATGTYSKEAIDEKLAGVTPEDVLPVSKGGTGVTTAAAERNRLGLGNTIKALPIANGGTGSTDASSAFKALHSQGAVSTLTDNDFLSAMNNSWQGKSVGMSAVWSWIKSKIQNVFGFNSSNVLTVANGGTGSTTAEAARKAIGAGTSSFSGDYNDLENKPTIPTLPETYDMTKASGILAVENGGTGADNAIIARSNLGIDVETVTRVTGAQGAYYLGEGTDEYGQTTLSLFNEYRGMANQVAALNEFQTSSQVATKVNALGLTKVYSNTNQTIDGTSSKVVNAWKFGKGVALLEVYLYLPSKNAVKDFSQSVEFTKVSVPTQVGKMRLNKLPPVNEIGRNTFNYVNVIQSVCFYNSGGSGPLINGGHEWFTSFEHVSNSVLGVFNSPYDYSQPGVGTTAIQKYHVFVCVMLE